MSVLFGCYFKKYYLENMQIHKMIIPAIAFVATLSGCASSYSNKELSGMFQAKGLEAKESERGVVVFLPGVFFEYDKADLTPLAKLSVTDIATITNDSGVLERNLLIEGHTDSNGSDDYNQKLSEHRAESVQNGLIAAKVDPARMSARGFGEKYPIAQDFNADGSVNFKGQAKNRRVEVVLKNPE